MAIDDDLRLFQPVAHRDERGAFYESYNQEVFDRWLGRSVRFVQDNHSISGPGVLRGIHYQLPPRAQAKLVRVTRGAVFDVAVDLRRSSPSFGQWRGFELSAENGLQLWVPEGYGHGFMVLGDGAEVQYKTTDFYSPDHDRAVRWDDPDLGIDWPLGEEPPLLGARDASAPTLDTAELFE